MHRQLHRRLGHYAAFIRSVQDPSKWFYTNDAQVYNVYIEPSHILILLII